MATTIDSLRDASSRIDDPRKLRRVRHPLAMMRARCRRTCGRSRADREISRSAPVPIIGEGPRPKP